MQDALANRATLSELVATYQEAQATVRRCFAELAEAEDKLNASFTLGGHHAIQFDMTSCHHHNDWRDVEATIGKLRRRIWWLIVDRTRADLPDVTMASVTAFVEKYERNLPAMIEAAIREVHEWLRPRGRSQHGAGRFKTNSLYEVGPRVVLPGVLHWSIGASVRFDERQRLTALENVFLALDGKGYFTKAHGSALEDAINLAVRGSWEGETDYFSFRAYRNTNVHLTFRRPDLLARFNQIAGGAVLKPGRGPSAQKEASTP